MRILILHRFPDMPCMQNFEHNKKCCCTCQQPKTKSAFCPDDIPGLCLFFLSRFYLGIRLFADPKKGSRQLSGFAWISLGCPRAGSKQCCSVPRSPAPPHHPAVRQPPCAFSSWVMTSGQMPFIYVKPLYLKNA